MSDNRSGRQRTHGPADGSRQAAEAAEGTGGRMSFEEAARAIEVTPLTVRRIEKAEVGLRIPYVKELLRTYRGAGDGDRRLPRAGPGGRTSRAGGTSTATCCPVVQRLREPGERSQRHPSLRTPLRPGPVADERLRHRAHARGLPQRVEGGRRPSSRPADQAAGPARQAGRARHMGHPRRDGAAPACGRGRGDAGSDRPAARGPGHAEGPDPGHALRGGGAPRRLRPVPPLPLRLLRAARRHLHGKPRRAVYVEPAGDVVTYLEVLDRMPVQAEPVARTRAILAELRKEL